MSSSKLEESSDPALSLDQRQPPTVDTPALSQLQESQASSEPAQSVPVAIPSVSSTIGQRIIGDRAVISYGKKRRIITKDESHHYSSEEEPHSPTSIPTSPTKSLRRKPTSTLGHFDQYAELAHYTEHFEISITPSGFTFLRTDGSSAMLPSLIDPDTPDGFLPASDPIEHTDKHYRVALSDPYCRHWLIAIGTYIAREILHIPNSDQYIYQITSFPAHYVLTCHFHHATPRKKNTDAPLPSTSSVSESPKGARPKKDGYLRRDGYLYGSASGVRNKAVFRSPNEFFPHVRWLLQKGGAKCECIYCDPAERPSVSKRKVKRDQGNTAATVMGVTDSESDADAEGVEEEETAGIAEVDGGWTSLK